jgi:hypothetical protein
MDTSVLEEDIDNDGFLPIDNAMTWEEWFKLRSENVFRRASSILIALIIPVLQLLAVMCLILVISVVSNLYFRRVSLPSALIHQRVYFNHLTNNPVANINLQHSLKQWTYLKNDLIVERDSRKRFLKVDSLYDIHVVFSVHKSQRNYGIGTSAAVLSAVDSTGEVIAKSVRPVVMPYQSPVSLFLESVAFFPLRACGALEPSETVDLLVSFMIDYREPHAGLPPTEALEIALSVPALDISYAYLTVMPQLNGVE